jgi:hypothetical protein
MPLAIGIQFADFIEEQSSATLTNLGTPPIFKISQLQLERLHRKSRATEFHEWQSPLAREFVDLPGHDFFASPTFALDKNGNFCRRNLRQEPLHRLHFGAQG